MTLMLHVNDSSRAVYSAEGRDIRCFGFGCPPVFASTEEMANATLVEKAFNNTFCFINCDDVIPHLSIDAIRRLAVLLSQVHAARTKPTPGDQYPIQNLVDIVKKAAADLKPLQTAERLKIPGKFVVWISNADDGGKSDVVLCEPAKVSNLGFRLMGNLAFMNDHLPPQYERRFKDLDLSNYSVL